MTDLIPRSAAPSGPPEQPSGGADLPGEGAEGSRSWVGLAGLLAALAAVAIFLGPLVLLVILAIVASIFLHEAGHYLAARRSGMKATEFFLGFGPRIWSFHRNGTEYGVKAVWAGAYVKIVGMSNLEEVPREDEAVTYRQQSFPRRLVTVFAGPGMNLVIAFVVLLGVSVTVGLPSLGSEWPRVRPADGSAAAAAGLLEGDELLRFDGEPVPDFDDFRSSLTGRGGDAVEVVYQRDGEQFTETIELDSRVAGISARDWPEIEVSIDSPAVAANLDRGDRVVAVGDDPAPASFDDFADRVLDARGSTLPLVIERAGHRYATELPVPSGTTVQGLLGVAELHADPEPESLASAVPATAGRFAELGWLSLYGIYSFFSPSGLSDFADNVVSTPPIESDAPRGVPASEYTTGSTLPDLPAPELSALEDEDRVLSILGIVRLGGQLDLVGVVWLIAVMNMFLAVFNLLPLLPFDGGHIMVATYERVREGLARRRWVPARLVGNRYFADFGKLIPLTYAVVAVVVAVGLGALWLDVIDPPTVAN